MKLFGSLTAISFSPIVTIEPRRRKFHCPIKLRIPLPSGHRPDTSGHLRLLCSITGGQSKAIWEDVTGSTPLTIHEKCLLFTTTVSARFWLVHCQRAARCQDAARFAQELWRYLIQVPFMAKFVVFAKRRDISEAQVRVFCMTDDKEEKTLEVQEHYTLVARSRDVEVLDNQLLYLEFGGNLIPGHLNGLKGGAGNNNSRGASHLLVASSSALLNEQLSFAFRAFAENRLAFACRLREVGQDPSGRIAFMEDSLKYLASLNAQQRAYLAERRRRAVCTLGVQLPAMCVHYDNILGTPKRNSYYATARIGDLTLADIASELSLRPAPPTTRDQLQAQQGVLSDDELGELDSLNGDYASGRHSQQPLIASSGRAAGATNRKPDWMLLAPKVGIPRDEVDFIAEHCGGNGNGASGKGASAVTPALFFLMHWYRLSSPDDRDQDLARGLIAIGREDIATKLNFPVEPKRISRSTMELLREIEAIPVRSTENLYGTSSELSGYATSGGVRSAQAAATFQRPSQSRGASLRRLDSQPSIDASESSEQQRARAGSASSATAARRSQARNEPPAEKYFSSGLRSTGQSSFNRTNDDDDDGADLQRRKGAGRMVDAAYEPDVGVDDVAESTYSRTLEQTRISETITSTKSGKPQSSSKRQRRRKAGELAAIGANKRDNNTGASVADAELERGEAQPPMGRRRKRTSRRSSEQHYELQVPAVGISVDERQPDAAQAAAAAAVQAAPSSVRAALRAQQARAIPESASSSSGGGALNPDLDCSSDGSSSSSSGASDDTSASSRRDALVRCCCARPRSNAQARRQRRPQRRQTRQLNSSSTAGKVRAQFSELDGGGGGGCASANRAESESASREQSRASKSAFARLRLRERNAQAVEPPKRARARVRKFNVGNAGSLSASKRGPEVGPSETAQGAAESENATPSSDGQAAAAFASESKSTRNGRSKRKGKGASLPRRANSKGSSWSSKASSFGPKVRIDLDFGARSSREGYARALLAHCWRRQSKLSERREEEEEERDAPCKFKAASRRVSCAQVPPGARVNEASPFATAGAPLALTHESDQERVANWQARRSETDVATADVRRDGTGSGTKNASLFAADTSSDGSSGGRRIICSRGGGDSSEWNLHVTEQTFTSGGGSSRDAMRFQVRESSLGLCVRKDKTLDNGQARALSTASELDAQPTRSDLDKLSQAYAGEATAAFASADIELGTAAAAAAVPLASCKANGLRTKRANSCASVRNKVPECSRVLALICETRTEMHAHEATCAIGIRQRKHSTASTAAAATQAAVRRAGALRLAQQQQQQQEKSCFCYSPSSSSPSSSPSRRRRERGDKAVCPSKSPTASIEQLKSLAKEIDNKLAYLGDDERRRASLHEAVSGQQRKARPQVLKCWTTRSQKFEVRGSGGGGGGDDGQVRQSASASFARKRLSLQTFEVDVEDHKIISTSLHEGNLHQAKLSRSTTNSSLCYSTYHSPSFIREIEEVRESLLDSANESQESISASSSTETIITTATYKTAPSTTEGSTPTRKEKSNMVSFVELDSSHESTSGDASTLAAAAAAAATTKQMSNLAALHMDSVEMEEDEELQQESTSSDGVSGAARPKQKPQQQQQQQQQKQKSGQLITSLELDDDLDEEQLKRILACKRLSEGNCASAVAAMQHLVQRPSMQSAFCRKNSLHMIGESLPPVTEGEPMRHMSHHMSSQNMGAAAGGGHQQAGCSGSTSGSSSTASSLRSKQLACKRNSQDDNTASCSSSTSLDGGSSSGAASVGLRSPSRRRSSTVSQCSSVLSEGTRQQLNFDLSPDLAPDSSLLEANTISPTDFDRPASPEPSSPGADDAEDDSSSFDMRPISRMSAFYCDEIMLTASPDSTLGDSNDNNNPNLTNNNNNNNNNNNSHFATINQQQQQQQQQAQTQQIEERQRHDANIRDNLERIISHVSTVRVSGTNEAAATTTTTRGDSHEQQLDNGDDGAGAPVAGQKRAHTPFGLNVQRNKTTLMSPPTPSPTAPADSKAGCE